MDLAHLLQHVASLSEERKQQLIEKHKAGTLSDKEKEEIAQHLIKAKVELEHQGVVENLLM